MKKYNLNLKENEELIVDVDDLMETELVKFVELTKDLKEEEIKLFNNWIKIYKILNYDIIDDLQINNVYKFNDYSAIIELTFRGSKEFDIINLNPEMMTVACMSVKNNSVRPYIVRRLLIPDTVEDALSFAKSELPNEGIKAVAKTITELEKNNSKYNVTNSLNLNNNDFELIQEKEPEVKETEPDMTRTVLAQYRKETIRPPKKETEVVIARTVLPQYRKETIRPSKKETEIDIARTVLPQYRKETIRPPKKVEEDKKQEPKKETEPDITRTVLPQYRKETIRPPKKVKEDKKQEPKKVKEGKSIDAIYESIKDDGGIDVTNLFAKLR